MAEAVRREVIYCETCKTDKEVLSTERVSDNKQNKTLDCGHKWGKIVKVVNEKINITEKASWVILKDPVAEVRKAVNDKDYFKTVTYACSVLEYTGQMILLWHSKNTPKPLTDKEVQEWKLDRVTKELRKCGLITDTDVMKIDSIRKLRTKFIHENLSIRITSEIAEQVDALNDDIIYYVGHMKDKYDKSAPA
jgi:hypothetical protein